MLIYTQIQWMYEYMCMYVYIYIYVYMVIVYIYIYICVYTPQPFYYPFMSHSLTHSLTDAIPPVGGIGGAAHSRSWIPLPRAPRAVVCTQKIGTGVPIPDPFSTSSTGASTCAGEVMSQSVQNVDVNFRILKLTFEILKVCVELYNDHSVIQA